MHINECVAVLPPVAYGQKISLNPTSSSFQIFSAFHQKGHLGVFTLMRSSDFHANAIIRQRLSDDRISVKLEVTTSVPRVLLVLLALLRIEHLALR